MHNLHQGDGPPYNDLDELAGSWTRQEAEEFNRFVAENFERIDPDDWK